MTTTDKVIELIPVFIDKLPDVIEEGKIYISKEFEVSEHLCPCGCKNHIFLPFSLLPTNKEREWHMTEIDGKVSFNPSIGNSHLPCKSHYYISQNKIQWA